MVTIKTFLFPVFTFCLLQFNLISQTISWKEIDYPGNTLINQIVIDEQDRIFCSTNEQGIIVSTDEGESWTIYSQYLTGKNVKLISVGKDRVLIECATETEDKINYEHYILYLSQNKIIPLKNLPEQSYSSAIITKQGTIFIATESGVYQSTNDGVSWKPAKLKNKKIRYLSSSDNKIVAADIKDVYISEDEGKKWTPLIKDIVTHRPGSHSSITGLFATNNSVFISAWNSDEYLDIGIGVFSCSDIDKTWKDNLHKFYSINSFGSIGGKNCLTSCEEGYIFKTDEKGINWFYSYLGARSWKEVDIKDISIEDEDAGKLSNVSLIAGNSKGKIFIYSDRFYKISE